MRAVVVETFGGPEVLELQDVDDPVAPPGGYVVSVAAAAINFADVVERRGLYKRDQRLPLRMGKEAAGVVVERHPDAVGFEVGDPVIVVCFGNGCYAERVAVQGHEVLRPPRGLTFAEMAAFGTAFATAWYGMHEIARVRPGESALIPAAAGGVGTAAVLLARSVGCGPVIGTAGGSAKCELVTGLGADACVDYAVDDLRDTVRELTDGRGVDYCLESVGGETYARCLESLAPMGRLVVIGFSSVAADYANAIPRLHPLSIFQRSIVIGGLNLDNLEFTRRRDTWDALVAHSERHELRPVVGQLLPFEDVQQAHTALESRRSTGKVVLSLDGKAEDVPVA
ncbi:MAG TPA: zinc-binding dehydrogenase [Acidimicrobiales bacterium]|nr:zinc-binding dehydrogenase [Acidimicrobiales bacterium]